jgi:hypothetical protein
VVLLLALASCTRAPADVASAGLANNAGSASPSGRTKTPTPAAPISDHALPPSYLAWQHDGLAPGLAPKLARLAGVEHVVEVAGDTTWMVRSIDASGHTIDAPPSPFLIPIETQAVDPRAFSPFVPPASRDEVESTLEHDRGVIGATSARLRGVGVGGSLSFRGGVTVRVGAVVPDVAVNWAELLVPRALGRRLGVVHDRFALLDDRRSPADAVVARQIRPLVDPSQPLRIQGPGEPEFRRYADSVWPPVLMKVGFGEFAARPDAAHPGYLLMDPAFVRRHVATRTVPLLGAVTCNTKVFDALDAAMGELERRGLASVIHGFAGCYSPRMVLRVPTAPISHHAWGAAVDINAAQNPFGAAPDQDPRLVEAMRRHGFTWGGLWALPDGMHFEYRVPGVGT